MDNKFKPLLSMLFGYYGIVDKKSNIIKTCYKENLVFAQNVDINTFLDMFDEREHLDPKSYDRSMLVPWILKNTKENAVAVTAATKDTKEKKYMVRLLFDESDEFYFYIFKPTNDRQTFSLFDKLTRIFLREGIETLIRNELASVSPRPFTIIIIDVDNFKTINDMYGHLFGDHILKAIASMLKEFSLDCNVGRIGGDEFLIQDFTSQEYEALWTKLHALLERIRKFDYVSTYKNADISKVKLEDFHATVTAGVVCFPKDGETYDSLFLKADKALYRGKRKGRNCYIIYDDEKHKNISVDKSIEFDSPTSRELLIYEKLIYNGLLILDSDGTVESNLKKYLDLFGEYIIADRIVLYKHTEAFKDKLVACYTNKNIEEASEKYIIQEVIESEDSKYMDLLDTYKRSKIEVLKNLKPGVYEFLYKQKIKSFIQLPIAKDGILYGFIRFDSVLEEHKWKEEEITLYHIMADCLSNYIFANSQKADYDYVHERDSLTGLASYKSSLDKITSILTCEKKSLTIGVTDLYKFRYYNDTFGYSHGDNIIRLMAHALKSGNFLFLGRLNGDHFVFLSEETNEEKLKENISSLSCSFKESLKGLPGEDVVQMRFGLYTTDSVETNARACIDKSRLALLEMTQLKDATYKIYDVSLNDEYIMRRDVLNQFKEDIDKNKLEIFLQPKINAKTNELVGAEALSRWKKEDGTYWAPFKYISILESENEIERLDLYNTEAVLKYLAGLKVNGIKLFPISVNLSKHQKDIVGFVDKIEVLRKKYKINPHYLQIEITETAFENNYDETFKAIKKLKDYGYTICMDDFGVGYSNLELLATGDFDIIKFDKALVDKTDKFGRVVFKYSVDLVRSLGLTIVFEGVETREQVDYVLNNKGQIIQGYYYSRPIALEEFNQKYLK